MGGACCKQSDPEWNPDGTQKAAPPKEQQARDPEELRKTARAEDAAGLEVLLRRMPMAAINSGTGKQEGTPEQLGDTALHIAAAANWLTGCRMLVLYGASQKVRNAAGKTPLHLAVENGKRKVTAYLLELEEALPPHDPQNPPMDPVKPWRKGDPKAKDGQKRSVLLSAFLTGRQLFTSWFIDACRVYGHSLDFDNIDAEGESAAVCCARFGWWDMLKDKVLPALTSASTVFNTPTKNGETVLGWLLKFHVAGELNAAQVQEWIQRLPGVDVNVSAFKERIPPLALVAGAGDQSLIDLILSMGSPTTITDKDIMGRTALHYAAAQGHKDVALDLISKGAVLTQPDKNKATPFHLAAMRGHGDVARALLDALPEAAKASALAAINSSGYNMAHLTLLSKKCDDASQKAILKLLEIMDESVYHQAVQDKKKDTPLMLAVTSHLDLVVRAMLDSGVDCNVTNAHQESPLARILTSVTKVTAARDARIFDMLIKAGAVVDTPNPTTHPVMAVCRSDVGEFSALAVKTLEALSMGELVITAPPPVASKAGAEGKGAEPIAPPEPKPPGPLDWDKEDEEGRNPFMLAASHNNLYVIKYLVTKTPDIINKQTDKNGMTALMWAASNARVEALRVLLDLGADLKLVDKDGHDALWHAMRMDKPETLDCAAMLILKGAKTRLPAHEGRPASDYLDITGEGWLHRAVRYGAVEFIQLWARMGGNMAIQCTTPETADDMPGGNEVSVDEVTFMEQPLEEREEEEWCDEVVEPDADGVLLKVDPNNKLAGAPAAGPVAESWQMQDTNNMTASMKMFVAPLLKEEVQTLRAMGHKWFDTYCSDVHLYHHDQDDPVYEEMQEYVDVMTAKNTGIMAGRQDGGIDQYAVEYHVMEQLAKQRSGTSDGGICVGGKGGPVAEGEERTSLMARMASWTSVNNSSSIGNGVGEDRMSQSSGSGGAVGGRLAKHRQALCEAVVMRNEEMEDVIIKKIEADMRFDSILLSGQDPLHPDLLAARCGIPSLGSSPLGILAPGPVGESTQVHPEPQQAAPTTTSMKSMGASIMQKVDKVTAGPTVVNNDPYYAKVQPDVHAVRKYEGVPSYVSTAKDASKPYTPQELDAKADELHARLKNYTATDKQADGGLMLYGPALRARWVVRTSASNISRWNVSLSPIEYPLKLGSWRQLGKKKEQAIAAARARAPAPPGTTIKPRKKTAFFGLPDMPSRPELLNTGAVTYAVRLNRPDCVSALLELSAGTVNVLDGYGYPALSYALCMMGRDPSNKSLAYTVDTLLQALPDANLITRFRPVTDPKQRKQIIKFVKKNMDVFGDCWVDSDQVDKSMFAGGAKAPDEDAIIGKLYKKLMEPADEKLEKWRRSARSVLGLCRADPLEPLVACVALGDESRLAWLVRKCGAALEAAWVHLPDIPTYYQGLIEKDVATCLSVCAPLHIAVAMRKFSLSRLVLDLGGDPNACGTPKQEDIFNPWSYAQALDKIRDTLQDGWREELKERAAASVKRKEIDEELLAPEDQSRERFTEKSRLTGTTANSTGGVQSEEEKKAANSLKSRIVGGIMERMKKLKRLIQMIEIPGFTKPHPWVTPLHLAARVGKADIAFLLIDRGALPDGGISRLFAKRSPLQEAVMYARANFVEGNTQAPRPHHNTMQEGVQASIPDMNGELQAQATKEIVGAALKSFYDPTVAALKAFALTVKFIVNKVMEMRNRPIAHWDPALATAHVLLRARAPIDAAETQTSIVLRDLMDNSTWSWLGPEVKTGIKDEAWMYEAQLYTYRLKESDSIGHGPMARSADLKWYRFAKKFFTNRCDSAYFGAGVKALTDVYNKLSSKALEDATLAATNRTLKVQQDRQVILKTITQARKQLLATQGAQLQGQRQAVAEQLGSPCVFDSSSFELLVNDALLLSQEHLSQAAESALEEARLRGEAVDTTTAEDDGGAELPDAVKDMFGGGGGNGGGGGGNILQTVAGKAVEAAGDKAAETVEGKIDKAFDKKNGESQGGQKKTEAEKQRARSKVPQGTQHRPAFAVPTLQPLKKGKDDPELGQLLARATDDYANNCAKDMLEQMKDLAKEAAREVVATAYEAVIDHVLDYDLPEQDVAAAGDAADVMESRLEAFGSGSAGWDMGDENAPDADMIDVSGAVGAVADLVDGLGELLDFAG